MIVIKKRRWLRALFRFHGTSLEQTWPKILLTTAVAVVLTYADMEFWVLDLTTIPFSMVGVTLGIFLGFRNNTSYDRFWEGRKLWGSLVNTARTLARQYVTLVGPMDKLEGRLTDGTHSLYRGSSIAPDVASDEDTKELLTFHREMVRRVAAYVHALRLHLRDEKDYSELASKGILAEDEVDLLYGESNPPISMLTTMGQRGREAWLRGWVHPMHLRVLEETLTVLCNVQGACERIRSTPIPFTYSALLHRLVHLYCYALPFGLVSHLGAATPLVVAVVAYCFFGLDSVGEEIEDPFGKDANDLPLLQLSTMIEVNVRQRVGDTDLPEFIKPNSADVVI